MKDLLIFSVCTSIKINLSRSWFIGCLELILSYVNYEAVSVLGGESRGFSVEREGCCVFLCQMIMNGRKD